MWFCNSHLNISESYDLSQSHHKSDSSPLVYPNSMNLGSSVSTRRINYRECLSLQFLRHSFHIASDNTITTPKSNHPPRAKQSQQNVSKIVELISTLTSLRWRQDMPLRATRNCLRCLTHACAILTVFIHFVDETHLNKIPTKLVGILRIY